jgi:HPt (histidine-containing phosphotransfer) domain-containing protein
MITSPGNIMSPLEDRSTKVAVNRSELLTRVENDRELLRELIGIFEQEFPGLRESLEQAVARGDMQAVAVTSHTLKGMFSNLCATWAAATAQQLELMAREGNEPGVKDALAVLEYEVASTLSELNACAAE